MNPQNNDVITTAQFTIEVEVTGKHCSHDFSVLCDDDVECGANSQCIAPSAIDSVELCVDSGICETPIVDPATGNYTLDFDTVSAGWTVGTSHTVECRATNLGGFLTTDSVSVIYNFGVTNLSNTETPGNSRDVVMAAAEEGTLHFVWSDQCVQYGFGTTGNKCRQSQSGNSPNDIFHRSFGSNGWSDITLISDAGGAGNMDGSDVNPVVAIDDDNLLHIAWSSNGQFGSSGGDFDIFHRTVDLDSNNALGTLTVVDNQGADQGSPAMAAAPDGTIHLVWEDQAKDILHARWDSGTWSSATKISDHANDGNSTTPALAMDSSSAAHVVWQELGKIDQSSNADADIYHRSVTVESNGNVTLSDYLLVSDNGSDNTQNAASRSPDVAVSSTDRVVVVWEDTLNSLGMGSDTDIYLRTYAACATGWCSENADESWTYYQRVTLGSSSHSESARVAFQEDGSILVGWSEAASASDEPNIKFTHQLQEGSGLIAFDTPQPLMATDGLSANVDILVDDSGNVHFAWQDGGNEATDDLVDGLNPNGEEDDDIFYQILVISD